MSIPKLRFKGFNEEWQNAILSQYLSFNNGINADKDSYGHGRKFINVLDILNNNYIKYDDIIGSVSVPVKLEESNKVEFGDILFLRSSETREDVGKSSVYLDKDKYALFGGFVIRGKKLADYHPYFLKLNLESSNVRNQIGAKAGGSTRFNVSQAILSSVEIKMPLKSEQTKIASFLTMLDKKIQKQQDKVELLKQQKKGLMQKIFSQGLRFKDENGEEYPEWKEVSLDKISTIEKGTQINRSELEQKSGGGKYPVYNGGITTSGYYTDYNREPNSIIISEGGNSCGYVNFVKEHFWSGGHSYTISSEDNLVDRQYLFQILKENEKKIMALRVGSGLPNIQKSALQKYKIFISSSLIEQRKIAGLLRTSDQKIEKEEKKLVALKEQNQAFMQQMFI